MSKYGDLKSILEYMDAKKPKEPVKVLKEKKEKQSPIQQFLAMARDFEDFQAYLKSKEKKEEKKDDKKKDWKIETLNQAILLTTIGPFIGIMMAGIVLRKLGFN